MPKPFIPVFLLVALPLSFTSCETADFAAASPPAPAFSAGAVESPQTVASASESAPASLRHRKLVHTGSQSVNVPDLKVAVFETRVIVKSNKGYVESSTVRADKDADLKLRVPPAHLTATLDEIARLGKETRRHLSVDDVTRQYIDLDAELTNLRALRSRLRTLLAKAANVKEALEVEKELTRVQTRIDSLQSQLTALRNQIAYSKIALSLERKGTLRLKKRITRR